MQSVNFYNYSLFLKFSYGSPLQGCLHVNYFCCTVTVTYKWWVCSTGQQLLPGENRVLREKPVPVTIFSPQIPQGLTWDCTPATARRGTWLISCREHSVSEKPSGKRSLPTPEMRGHRTIWRHLIVQISHITSWGFPSYNKTLLCHSCTLCGFCRNNTEFKSKSLLSMRCSNRASRSSKSMSSANKMWNQWTDDTTSTLMIHLAHDISIFQVSETTNLLYIHSTLHLIIHNFVLLFPCRCWLSWDVSADAHVTGNIAAMLENMTKQMPWSFHDIRFILLSSNVRHHVRSKVLEHTACLHLQGRTVLCHKTEGIYIPP